MAPGIFLEYLELFWDENDKWSWSQMPHYSQISELYEIIGIANVELNSF